MKTAVYYKNSDVRIEERPKPTAGEGEILIHVRASGICGSDIMEWYRIKKAPIVLGHEIAGEVVEVGAGVTKYKVGDRVAANHHVPCNTCRYCLDGNKTCCETLHTTGFNPGGFSEFVCVPPLQTDRGVYLLPDSMSFDEGSFVEPLACVRRGQRIAGVKPTKTVLVLGAGISGALHIALAKSMGCANVLATDINPWRLENAKKLGATAVTDAREDVGAWVRANNDDRGADIIFVCAGAKSALDQALASVDRGGTVMFFAVPGPGTELAVPVNDFWRDGITLLPSYANDATDAMEAIDLIASGAVPVADMITHRLPLSEAQEGFRLTAAGGESLKVVLIP
jgi:L-iditol 2-dehydrogenase